MNYIKKLSRFIVPYKRYAVLNIICNVFYALFGTLAMVSLMPMINILFNETKTEYVEPEFLFFGDYFSKDKVIDYFNFFVTNKLEVDGPKSALTFMIVIIISLFLLKNLFNYLGLYYITYLRNGVLKDIRNEIYNKTLRLPISFFSEKRKGDIIARISGDVNEVQSSLLSILELIVKEPLTIIFAIIAMFLTSVKLTIFVFLFIPVSGFIISAIGKKLKKHSEKVFFFQL
jgi:subfamily B ATP-binding cassette protein MsbA